MEGREREQRMRAREKVNIRVASFFCATATVICFEKSALKQIIASLKHVVGPFKGKLVFSGFTQAIHKEIFETSIKMNVALE